MDGFLRGGKAPLVRKEVWENLGQRIANNIVERETCFGTRVGTSRYSRIRSKRNILHTMKGITSALKKERELFSGGGFEKKVGQGRLKPSI